MSAKITNGSNGEMQIINNQNIITDEQLKDILKILGRDYKPLKIVIYESRLDMLKFYPACFNFTWEEFSGRLEGSFDDSSDTVYIFIYSQTDDGDDIHSKQLYSLHALVHELRHRYQYVNDSMYNDDEVSEKDADRFATKFINKRSSQIRKIMHWDDEWTVEEED